MTKVTIDSNVVSPDQLVALSTERARVAEALKARGYSLSPQAELKKSRTAGVTELWDASTQYRFALTVDGSTINVHHWDDWYDYPNSYWYPENKKASTKENRVD